MKHFFEAEIYKIGINWCVDVPKEVTEKMIVKKGRIKIKGKINGFVFKKTLMPVKNATHRLFVNQTMMKGGKTALGEIVNFEIEQDTEDSTKEYPIPNLLNKQLIENQLTADFEKLTISRKREILKYLNYIRTEETLLKNITKLITQLKNKEKNIRIP